MLERKKIQAKDSKKRMKESYRFVHEGGSGEVVEKKSRFIAVVRPVETEEEALSYIEALKKKYWDARHHCFAYVIGERLQRFSDDGEPQGTAGKPILDIILGEKLTDALIVVIRYFGGTLLGTGGLVRAYSQSARIGLQNSVILEKQKGIMLEITTDYNGIGKIQHIIGKAGLDIWQSDYTEKVMIKTPVPMNLTERVINEIMEATSAQAVIEKKEELHFAKWDKELLVFPN